MSLYLEAASVVENPDRVGGSLKSRIYGNKSAKTTPAQIYALVTESTKWSPILKEVVEKSRLLEYEKKVIWPALCREEVHGLILLSGALVETDCCDSISS